MKPTTPDQHPEVARKLRELIQDISIAMLTTVTPDGALRSRPMATQPLENGEELWFFLADDSGKAHDVAEEQGVNVSYADIGRQRYVSVSGNASVVHDDEKVHDLWRKEYERFFPRGLDDPHLALLCVRIETAEYWDASAGRMVSLHETPGSDRGGGKRPEGEHAQVDIRATRASG